MRPIGSRLLRLGLATTLSLRPSAPTISTQRFLSGGGSSADATPRPPFDGTMAETLQVKKLSEHATIPTRGSPDSAGYDLYAAQDTVIPAGGKGIVATDLSLACPAMTYARIAPRSGLAVKKFIDVGAGVVDADYRGPVGVVLFNFGAEDFTVSRGDRVAQMVLERICMAPIEEVAELPETVRGAGGFGSTGVSAGDTGAGTAANKVRVISPSPVNAAEATPEQRLRALEDLKKGALVTDEEYAAKRAEIIALL